MGFPLDLQQALHHPALCSSCRAAQALLQTRGEARFQNLVVGIYLRISTYIHGYTMVNPKNKPQAIGGLLVCVPNTCCFLADISGREKIGLQPNHQTLQPVQAASLLDISVFEPCNLDFLVNHRRINRGIQSPNQGIHMSGEVRGGHTPAVTPMVSQTFTGTL